MRVSNSTLALVTKALGAGVWEYNIDTDYICCSPRWYEILGIEERTSPINSIRDFRPHIHPDDVELATEVDLEKVSLWLANDEIYHVDFRIIKPDGVVRWVRSVACLIQDPVMSHRKAIGCITDVSAFQRQGLPITADNAAALEHGKNARMGMRPKLKTGVHLTNKEMECLIWVSLGKTATETGAILARSRRTVEFHLTNAVRKLGATNKIHATAIAIRSGLI